MKNEIGQAAIQTVVLVLVAIALLVWLLPKFLN